MFAFQPLKFESPAKVNSTLLVASSRSSSILAPRPIRGECLQILRLEFRVTNDNPWWRRERDGWKSTVGSRWWGWSIRCNRRKEVISGGEPRTFVPHEFPFLEDGVYNSVTHEKERSVSLGRVENQCSRGLRSLCAMKEKSNDKRGRGRKIKRI